MRINGRNGSDMRINEKWLKFVCILRDRIYRICR